MNALLAGALVLLGVTVVHEAGHWMAVQVKRGRVLRLEVGRGPILWSHTTGGGTELTLSLLPLGGRIHYEGVGSGTAQAVVAISGSVANLAFALIVFALAVWTVGVEGMPLSEGTDGVFAYAVSSVGTWFWMVPGALRDLVQTGMALEFNRAFRLILRLLTDGGLPGLTYVAAATSSVWAALNLIPIPIIQTDGWLVTRALWRWARRRDSGSLGPG